MKILLNGRPYEVPAGATLAVLLQLRRDSGHLKTDAYAVERNRELVPRQALGSTALQADDRIEVVVLVGGG